MASMIQYGSSGKDVLKLQQLLNQGGYNIADDGIFGKETQDAVRDYQKKNGLTVDGIVGDKTWAVLLPTGTGDTKSKTDTSSTVGNGFNYKDFSYDDFNYDKTYTPPKDFKYDDFQYGAYQESEVVTAAKNALAAQMANKPGEYKSQWQSQLDEAINKILNREKFSYDFNGDALYQQYKDKYIQQGKMAMADTMGQAATMTGGYGNSYAASVGNQAYQQSLQQLNDIVPELYQMAYDRYNQEGQDLYNQYAMLGERENMDYGRYRDSVNDWQTERDYLAGRYDSERGFDYSKYTDDRNFAYNQYADDRNLAYNQYVDDRNFEYGKYVDDRNYAYDKYVNDRNFAYGQYADDKAYAYNDYRDKIEDAQWQATFDEGVRQYNEQFDYQKGRDAVADAKSAVEYKAKYGGNDDNEPGGTYNNGSLTEDQVKALQKALGVTADGMYGADSQKAAGGLSAEEAYKKFVGDVSNEPAKGYFDYSNEQYNNNSKENGGSSYSAVLSDLKKMKSSGKSNKEAQAYLEELVGNSLITQSDYMSLYNKYRDGKLG